MNKDISMYRSLICGRAPASSKWSFASRRMVSRAAARSDFFSGIHSIEMRPERARGPEE